MFENLRAILTAAINLFIKHFQGHNDHHEDVAH